MGEPKTRETDRGRATGEPYLLMELTPTPIMPLP